MMTLILGGIWNERIRTYFDFMEDYGVKEISNYLDFGHKYRARKKEKGYWRSLKNALHCIIYA